MRKPLIITGTDTGIGKTIFAAALTRALQATYWKPVQCGLDEETDSEIVHRLSGCEVLPEAYRLAMPASPHLAAEAEKVMISAAALDLPDVSGPLIIEGAGGVMVPLNREMLFLNMFSRWKAPVILCARTRLGTINHTLLSLHALRHAGCEVLGVAFIGAPEEAVEASIAAFGKVRRLGRLPILQTITQATLETAFDDCFDGWDFVETERG